MSSRHYVLGAVYSFLASLLSAIALAQGKDANVSVSVERMEDTTPLLTVIVLAAVFIVLLLLVVYLLRYIVLEQKKKRALKEKPDTDADEQEYMDEHEDNSSELSADTDLDRYLKEDERNVLNILRQRGGVCSQSTLRIAGDFSKATLSRLLKELEERNIIKKEKRGKKNLVILR